MTRLHLPLLLWTALAPAVGLAAPRADPQPPAETGETEETRPETRPVAETDTQPPTGTEPVVSRCGRVTREGVDVRLVLRGAEWSGWDALCDRLVDYLRAGSPPLPPDTAEGAARLLQDTGFFDTVSCRSDRDLLACETTPQPMVYELDITGEIPFAILKDDLRRRVFLKPGALLEDERRTLARQRKRLEDFMRREGYFGSVVRLSTEEVDEARPNQGLLLTARVKAGRTVRLRRIEVRGQLPADYPRERLESWVRHTWFLWWFRARFRPEQFEDDKLGIAKDLQQRGYPEARVTGDYQLDLTRQRADVVLVVDPGPKITLAFEGNDAISDRRLAELATFQEAGVVDQVEMDATASEIRQLYQEKGFYEVKTQAVLDTPNEQSLLVTFQIEEGPRAKVVDLRFEGNETFTTEAIRDDAELLVQESGLLSKGRWVQTWTEADGRAIQAFYENRGYAASEVKASREVLGEGELGVTYTITEGPRRWVSDMSWEGLPDDVDAQALLDRLALVSGAPYVHASLGEDRREILTTLAASGYARAVVKRDLEKPDRHVGGPVTIHYRVLPGPKSLFGGVLVRGNFRTERGLIEDELGLEPGDPLDLVALGRARRRLRGLGPFASVDLVPLDLWREEAETWLLVALQERDLRAVDLVFGFSTDDAFSAGVEYRDRNLFGRAVRLDLRLRTGTFFGLLPLEIGRADLADGTIRAPTPWGAPFDVEGSVFYRFEDKSRFTERRIGGSGGLVRQIVSRETCEWCPSVNASLKYEVSAGFLDDHTTRFLVFDRSWGIPRANIGRVVPTLAVDRRDSFVDPRRGYAGDLRLELANDLLAPIGKGADFWRVVSSAQTFVPLGTPFERLLPGDRVFGGPIVLALGASYGAARPYGASIRVPDSETFYYGGDYSVRGMTDRGSLQGWPGAEFMVVANAELRWYVVQNFLLGDVQLAGFVDLGGVDYKFTGVISDPTISVGPALRFVTPVGPLSLAYGVAIRRPEVLVRQAPQTVPSRGRFHLTLGYPF